MGKFIDLTGQRFGRLVVVSRDKNQGKKITWLCRCDCGKHTIVRGNNLSGGYVNSCGCLRNDVLSERTRTHGKRHTRLYAVWLGMKERCYNPNHKNYAQYNGRGICEEWRKDFQAFYNWAMANGYDENAPQGKCTIDRIDNDKGYSPDNCRWVDMKTQINNRSVCRKEKESERN